MSDQLREIAKNLDMTVAERVVAGDYTAKAIEHLNTLRRALDAEDDYTALTSYLELGSVVNSLGAMINQKVSSATTKLMMR